MVTVNEYNDLHRAVLQTLIGHGTIGIKEFEIIFKELWKNFMGNEPAAPDDLDKIIDMINGKISPFDQKIILYEYSLTNDDFYVFYSTAKTSMSKMQTYYNEAELDFFKLILTKITANEELNMAPRDVLNLISQITGSKLNKLRAQKLLDSWIENNYFFKHSDNQIYLGPKTLAEFKELLQSMELEYLKSCLLCESVTVWGDQCASCHTIYHPKCIRKFLSRSEKCPSCKEKWAVPAQTDAD